jgi:hypothetical protein
VLGIPVLFIYLDETERVLRWRIGSISEALIMLRKQKSVDGEQKT